MLRLPTASAAAARLSLRQRRLRLTSVLVAAAIGLALFSAARSAHHIWWRIATDYSDFVALSPSQRYQAPATSVQVEGQIFDWYAYYLAKGDRFYVQVGPDYDPGFIRMLAGYYLLPAVEVASPAQATVVISYWENPNSLPIHYMTQVEAGEQPIWVSRIKAP